MKIGDLVRVNELGILGMRSPTASDYEKIRDFMLSNIFIIYNIDLSDEYPYHIQIPEEIYNNKFISKGKTINGFTFNGDEIDLIGPQLTSSQENKPTENMNDLEKYDKIVSQFTNQSIMAAGVSAYNKTYDSQTFKTKVEDNSKTTIHQIKRRSKNVGYTSYRITI